MISDYSQWCEDHWDVKPLLKRMKTSLPEQYVGFYLGQAYNGPIEYSKGFPWLGRKSFDIFLPELCVAIEYDGIRYHGDRSSYKDYDKNELCQEHGITLIRIREERIEQMDENGIILIPYPNTRTYSNIGIAVNALFEILNDRYQLSLNGTMKVNILQDNKAIVEYIQEKYYRNSMAYFWPESFLYWNDEKYIVTPFDLFRTDPVMLKCPYCGKEFQFIARYHHNRRSLVPCECEYRTIEEELKKVIQGYKEHGTLITFDDSFPSRRLYDRMVQDIKYYCDDIDALKMYIELGFDKYGELQIKVHNEERKMGLISEEECKEKIREILETMKEARSNTRKIPYDQLYYI